ncbi:MAG: siderophore-interacting protein [Myxococcota bacterium]
MAKPSYRVTVAATEQRTPNLRRLHLEGEDLTRFPDGFEGGYVKLLLTPEGTAAPAPEGAKRRSYTVRAFDRAASRLTLDFAAHGLAGPGTRWGAEAAVGDAITVVGPGAVKGLDPAADWVLLAGDMTALPALAVQLERLGADATGHAVIAVPSAEDRQLPAHPPGLEVHWLVGEPPEALVATVRAIPWRPGSVAVWCASEFEAMRGLRGYFRDERGVGKDAMYISSYWKRDATDEQHKAAKRADAAA